MKLTANRKGLLSALKRVSVTTEKSTTNEILKGVSFYQDGGLRLRTCSQQASSNCKLEADVEGEFEELILDCQTLTGYLGALTCESVSLVVSAQVVKLIGGSSSFTLQRVFEQEFPEVRFSGDVEVEGIHPLGLASAANLLEPFASDDGTRPVLSGLLLTGGKAYATNTHILGWVDLDGSTGDLSVPFNAIKEIEAGSKVELSKTAIRITGETGSAVSLLNGGTIPNVTRVIPTDCDHSVTVNRDALLQAVKRARLTAGDVHRIAIDCVNDVLSVWTAAGFIETMQVEGGVGLLPTSLNAKYVLTVLGLFESPTVTIDGTQPTRPVVFSDGSGRGAVVMPMADVPAKPEGVLL